MPVVRTYMEAWPKWQLFASFASQTRVKKHIGRGNVGNIPNLKIFASSQEDVWLIMNIGGDSNREEILFAKQISSDCCSSLTDVV